MPKSRILVVDDDAAIRDSLRMTLEYAGHEVTSAATGQEALALVEREAPDVVLLDIKMPGMDGMEVLSRLHGMSETLPIIMISGHGSTSTAVEAIRRGSLRLPRQALRKHRTPARHDRQCTRTCASAR